MKKAIIISLIFILLFSLISCGKPEEELTQIGNPWVDYDRLSDAEDAVGFKLGMPTEITGGFIAEEFRVMNNELLEIVYRDGDYEVTVRKAPGEDQDISGVYSDPEAKGNLDLYSLNGYSYSLYAPNGYWGDSGEDFRLAVLASE